MRQIKQKGEKFFYSKETLTFLLFLLLASSFWFANALNSKRQADLNIGIHYIGLPQGIKFNNELPEAVRIKVRDKGIKLFDYNQNKLQGISIDLSKKIEKQDSTLHISAQEIENAIASILLPTTDLISFSPEIIHTNYIHLTRKKVPVRAAIEAGPAPQYIFTSAIKTLPDTIEILGSKKNLDKIKYVSTEYAQINNIKKDFSQTIALAAIENVEFSHKSVTLQIQVEQFTEKKLTIPITFRNAPEDINIRTFPSEIEATFNVAMSMFEVVTQNDIQVIFDYLDLEKEPIKKYQLHVENKRPHIISNIKITPQDIEFLMEAK